MQYKLPDHRLPKDLICIYEYKRKINFIFPVTAYMHYVMSPRQLRMMNWSQQFGLRQWSWRDNQLSPHRQSISIEGLFWTVQNRLSSILKKINYNCVKNWISVRWFGILHKFRPLLGICDAAAKPATWRSICCLQIEYNGRYCDMRAPKEMNCCGPICKLEKEKIYYVLNILI